MNQRFFVVVLAIICACYMVICDAETVSKESASTTSPIQEELPELQVIRKKNVLARFQNLGKPESLPPRSNDPVQGSCQGNSKNNCSADEKR